MKINISSEFCTKIGILLVLLVSDNLIVSYVDGETEKELCRVTNKDACVILCQNWNLGSKSGARELKEIIKDEEKKHQNCSLILKHWTTPNTTWGSINLDLIVDLKLINSSLDLNRLNLQTFKNLQKLTIKNTTTISLHSRFFSQLPNLQELNIKKQNFIKFVDSNFLQNLSLQFLQIQGLNLNQAQTLQFFRNLTGGLKIPKIEYLDWSHNNFGNFTEDLLMPFPNLKVLVLTNCSISTFGAQTFEGLHFKSVFINQNKIQGLPEKIFRPLIENSEFVSLEENHIICDCQLQWLQSIVRRNDSQKIQIDCRYPAGAQFLNADMCSRRESPDFYCTPKNESETADFINFWPILNGNNQFTITKNEPELIEITIPNRIPPERVFLWYGCYANTTTPKFNCLQIQQQKFSISVTPDTNYLICLARIQQNFHCLPFKTKQSYEHQPWLTNKSMPVSIICIFIISLIAVATGAAILYLSVRKNPSLIRSKKVIEVTRHDKAKVLVNAKQTDPASLRLLNPRLPLEPSKSTLSCDTVSTVSYVSAHQPTQLEILIYRLNRLRQLYRRERNNLPPTVPRMSMPIAIPVNQRLPPDVDLLFEYEWYTITTTTKV